jgi:hypothetical protein
VDTYEGFSLAYPILKWVGRALILWNSISLCLAMLPFNNLQTEQPGYVQAISFWAFRIMANFLLLISVYYYIFA